MDEHTQQPVHAEHIAVIKSIYLFWTEKYQDCCWVAVDQLAKLHDDPDTECPVFGSVPHASRTPNGIRLFPLASQNAWKVERVIHLVQDPSRSNRYFWNKWIWKELSRSPDYAVAPIPYYARYIRHESDDDEYRSDSEVLCEFSDVG